MARRDGTGPEGKGPMTGKGLGRCGENKQNNQAGSSAGKGNRMNKGGGAGRGGQGRGQRGGAVNRQNGNQ